MAEVSLDGAGIDAIIRQLPRLREATSCDPEKAIRFDQRRFAISFDRAAHELKHSSGDLRSASGIVCFIGRTTALIAAQSARLREAVSAAVTLELSRNLGDDD